MSNDQNWYTTAFKSWQTKVLGPKPTAEQLAQIHGLKAKPGKQAMACAMALRDVGVTNAQIVMVCGNPQLNKMRGFITDSYLKRIPVAPDEHGHTVYKLEVTPKGKQRIARSEQQASKLESEGKGTADEKQPAKAKGKAKGTVKAKGKGKPKAADTATSEAVNAAEPVPAPQPADENQAA